MSSLGNDNFLLPWIWTTYPWCGLTIWRGKRHIYLRFIDNDLHADMPLISSSTYKLLSDPASRGVVDVPFFTADSHLNHLISL